jgi:hypothetical protein
MPAMIGGFGKIQLNTIKKRFFSSEDKKEYDVSKLRNKLGPYLAGLIESDGSIAVHDSESKSKKYNPKILIIFHINDKPLADKLCLITGVGKVYHKKDAGYVI